MSGADGARRVLIRADGSARIGLGHVMRSLTLARALVDCGADVRFIGSGIPDEERSRLPRQLAVIDRAWPGGDRTDASSAVEVRPDIVVVDGYHFTSEFFEEIESAGVPYAVIDDNGDTAARSPLLVLNQNPHATAGLYARMRGGPELLLGLGYALIRPEILDIARESLSRFPATVFVAMGGSDPRGLTAPIVEVLAARGRRVRAAIGPAHQDRTGLIERLGRLDHVSVVSPDDYGYALATCELAVLAAGSSLWEAACLGTPAIALIVAENQRLGAEHAFTAGLVLRVIDARGDRDDLKTQVAKAVAGHFGRTHAGITFDGGGAHRVANALLDRCAREAAGGDN